jgi:hypothetical protein
MAGDARDLCNHVVSAGTDVLTDVVNSSLVQNVLQSQVKKENITQSVVDPDPVGSGTFWPGRVERIVSEAARSFFLSSYLGLIKPQLPQRQFPPFSLY